MVRLLLAPTLVLACVASASGFTTTSPDVGKISAEALDALFLRAKPDMLKAAEGLDKKLQELAVLAAARFGHLLPQETRRKLQLSSILGQGDDVNTLVTGLRTQFCNDNGKQTLKALAGQGLTTAAESGLSGLPPLDPFIDAFWPCLCEDFTFTDPAWNTAFNAVPSIWDSGASIVGAAEGLIPVLFSSTGGLCTESCRQGGILLTDWLITAADLLVTTNPAIAQSLPFLPSIATSFAGFGRSLAKCVCDGVSWSGLVALFGSANQATTIAANIAITQTLADYAAGDVTAEAFVGTPFTTAINHLSTFPTFLLSDQGFCSTGCQEVRQEGRAQPMRERASSTARHLCPPIQC